MSYKVYNNWYNAKMKNEELKAGSNEQYLEDKIFNHIKACFDGIYNIAKFNRKHYFNLKENWALLRTHNYDAVLTNICEWLKKADDRFNGETWTEKVQSPKN